MHAPRISATRRPLFALLFLALLLTACAKRPTTPDGLITYGEQRIAEGVKLTLPVYALGMLVGYNPRPRQALEAMDDGLAAFAEAREMDPHSNVPLLLWGSILNFMADKQNHDKDIQLQAAKIFVQASKENPQSPLAHSLAADALLDAVIKPAPLETAAQALPLLEASEAHLAAALELAPSTCLWSDIGSRLEHHLAYIPADERNKLLAQAIKRIDAAAVGQAENNCYQKARGKVLALQSAHLPPEEKALKRRLLHEALDSTLKAFALAGTRFTSWQWEAQLKDLRGLLDAKEQQKEFALLMRQREEAAQSARRLMETPRPAARPSPWQKEIDDLTRELPYGAHTEKLLQMPYLDAQDAEEQCAHDLEILADLAPPAVARQAYARAAAIYLDAVDPRHDTGREWVKPMKSLLLLTPEAERQAVLAPGLERFLATRLPQAPDVFYGHLLSNAETLVRLTPPAAQIELRSAPLYEQLIQKMAPERVMAVLQRIDQIERGKNPEGPLP